MEFLSSEKMLGLEDLGFFPMIQEWESLVDDAPQTAAPFVKNHCGSGTFVDDILEEIEIDNGRGLDVQSDWLTDRVDLAGFELGFSELAELGLAGDFDTVDTGGDLSSLETSLNGAENIPEKPDSDKTEMIDLEVLLAKSVPTSPFSPEQCVPESNCFSPVPSPGQPCVSSPCSSDDTGAPSPAKSPPSPCIPSVDTDIGAIMSDSARVAKTIQNREKVLSSAKRHKVQPKVKTVSQKKRKQVQNRDAATRYRVKKKEEQDFLFKKAEELEKENSELSGTVASLTQEIEYLRKLMVEVYKARLLKSLPSV